MDPVLGRNAGVALAEALGIDIDGVRKVSLVCGVNEAAYVVIEKFVDKADVTALADTMKKYQTRPGEWTELRNDLETRA